MDLGSYGLTTNNLTIGSLSGVLKASSGVVSGEATTDDLPEGSNNLYFTTARARQSISANAPILYDNSTGVISHETSSQGDLTLSDGNVLASINLDSYGHIESLTTKNLDDRYYTETEADNRFVNVTGDTMTGALVMSGASIWIKGDNKYLALQETGGVDFRLKIDSNGNLSLLNDNQVSTVIKFLQNGNVAIGGTDPQGYKLYVNGTGYYADDLILNDLIQSSNFASGIFGSGWRIDKSESYLEIDNIMVRNTLRTHIFQKDIVKATNGYLYVSDSGIISQIDTGNNKVYFADGKSASFDVGDQLWVKDYKSDGNIISVKFTITEVGSSDSDQTDYTVQVDEGSLSDLQVGQTAVRISGGNILLDASSQYSPYVDILDEGEELVTNGDFSDYNGTIDDGIEDTFNNWTLQELSGDAEWYAVSDAPEGYSTALKYVQAVIPDQNWHHRLLQYFAYLSGGKYRLTFWAKASASRTIAIRDRGDSTGGLNKSADLTTSWKRFDFYFTANDNSNGIYFFLGGDSPDVYITGVSVKEISHLETRLGNLEGIANCSGSGLYGENTYLTKYLLVGDLTKSGHYLEYDGTDLTIVGNANISGTIHANDGDIAGWTIGTNKLYKNNIEINSGGYIKASNGGTTYWSLNNDGSGSLAQGNISWDVNGDLSVNKVTATSGTIGGWNIDTNKLYAGNLELNSTGDIQANYTEGSSGFKLSADGSAEFNNIIARGTIYATAGEIAGNLVTSGINADNITAGKIESILGTVVFDLDNDILKVNDTETDRIELGYLEEDVYGIRGYNELSNVVFELTNKAQKIGGWSFDKDKLYSGDFLIDGANKVIKTASSGQRIVIDGDNNRLQFYDTDGDEVIRIDDSFTIGYYGIGTITAPGINLYKGSVQVLAQSTEEKMFFSAPYYDDAQDTTNKFYGFVLANRGIPGVLKRKGYLDGIYVYIYNNPSEEASGFVHRGGYFNITSKTSEKVYGIYVRAVNNGSGSAYSGYFDGNTKIDGNLEVTGDINASNNTQTLSPTRSYLVWSYHDDFSSTTATTMRISDSSSSRGVRMIRGGKITGISLRTYCKNYTLNDTLTAEVYKNGTTAGITINLSITKTGFAGSQNGSLSLSFAQGDEIAVKFKLSGGTVTVGGTTVMVEIET